MGTGTLTYVKGMPFAFGGEARSGTVSETASTMSESQRAITLKTALGQHVGSGALPEHLLSASFRQVANPLFDVVSGTAVSA